VPFSTDLQKDFLTGQFLFQMKNTDVVRLQNTVGLWLDESRQTHA
jgi:hypothetical protein